jgi:hypothetical protein
MNTDDNSPLARAHARYVELARIGDQKAALAFVRRLKDPAKSPGYFDEIRAAAFTDAGNDLKRKDLLTKGETLWRGLRSAKPHPARAYNHANAMQGLWDLASRPPRGLLQGWRDSQVWLRQARAAFLEVARDKNAAPELAAQCAVNLGNTYDSIGRGIEAVRTYDLALARKPEFAMARGNRGIALLHFSRSAGTHKSTVQAEAYWDLKAALDQEVSVRRYGSASALRSFRTYYTRFKSAPSRELRALPRLSDPYAGWIQRSDLFLHPSPRCVNDQTETWDPIFFRGIARPIAKVAQPVPDEVGAFDVLKNEFVTARWLAWVATSETTLSAMLRTAGSRTGYFDSLDYARYDLASGMARQAFQAGNNLLDKIASFICLYLEIRRPRPYFRGWWRKDPNSKSDFSIHPLVEAELGAKPFNSGFWALTDLTADFEDGGSYWELQKLRHAATHRLLSLHESGSPPTAQLLVHANWAGFRSSLLEQLRVARAALIYLVQAVDAREARVKSSAFAGPLPLEPWRQPGGTS